MQTLQVIFAELFLAIVGSAILQARFTIAAKSRYHSSNRGVVHLENFRGLAGRASVDRIDNHQV